MAIYANLVVDQGTDFFSEVTVEGGNGLPYDLTGYTVQGQVRRTYTSSTAYPFTALVTDAPGGQISIELSNTATSQMKAGRYVYDLEIVETSTGDITRVVEGQLEVTPGVTR
jgi:Flp pilus assembly protein TadG